MKFCLIFIRQITKESHGSKITMEPKKSTDLKKIAQKLTEKHYPQWISRIDRIWDRPVTLDFEAMLSKSNKSDSYPQNALGISEQEDPLFHECMSMIPIMACANQTLKNNKEVSKEKLLVMILSAPEGI